ncbi:MAG: hypothetical protein IRZ07_24945 [Microbispora sp.]|nr:hypothetical protein [Microbispora sp.]
MMPKLKKVIAGLAFSTALAGGALAVSATAASADGGASAVVAPTVWGGSTPSFNTFGDCRSSCSSPDLDDIFWDVYVAGHCCDQFPAFFG